MKEPARWLNDEGVSPSLRRLLATGAGEVSFPEAARERVAMRLAAVTASSLAAYGLAAHAGVHGGAGASSTLGASTLAGLKLTGALVAMLIGAAATTALVDEGPRDVKPVASAVARAVFDRARVVGTQLQAPPESVELRPIGEIPWTVGDLPLLTDDPERAASSPSGLVARNDGFEREVAALREAQRNLDSNPGEVLGRLQNHRREFPQGRLGAERDLLELRALLALGRRGEAEALGDRMLQSESARLYHDRVRRLLKRAVSQ